MGVRWKRNFKPSDLLEKKENELKNAAIPVIAKKLADSVHDKATRYSPVGVRWIPPNSKNKIPTASGKLKKSWRKRRVGRWIRNNYRWNVWTDVEYAPYVEYGTSPHVIRPRNPDGVLVYYTIGGKNMSKQVMHPGTEPVYMLSRAVNETRATAVFIAKPILQGWAKGGLHRYRIARSDAY